MHCKLEIIIMEYIWHQYNFDEVDRIDLYNTLIKRDYKVDDYFAIFKQIIESQTKQKIFNDLQYIIKTYGTDFCHCQHNNT